MIGYRWILVKSSGRFSKRFFFFQIYWFKNEDVSHLWLMYHFKWFQIQLTFTLERESVLQFSIQQVTFWFVKFKDHSVALSNQFEYCNTIKGDFSDQIKIESESFQWNDFIWYKIKKRSKKKRKKLRPQIICLVVTYRL